MKKVIVIGAGASGLMAAIGAARCGAQVTLLEGMEKPGKKLLTTGNGRCNLTNLAQSEDCYRGADTAFIKSVLEQFPQEKTMAFFESLGLFLSSKNGYIYPAVAQASAVLDILLLECRRRHVKIKTREKVRALRPVKNGGWEALTDGWSYTGDAVILAAGSKAAPATGSDGSGYELAKQLGHRIVTPLEALVPLKAKEPWVKKLAGLRMPVKLTMLAGEDQYTEAGELQWTDYGISGIVVFQLSRYAVRTLREGKRVSVELDLLPEMGEQALSEKLQNRHRDGTAAEYLTGLLPSKMIPVLLERCQIKSEQKAAAFDDAQLLRMQKTIKSFSLEICGQKGFEAAQVCSGGVDCREVTAETLESKKHPGLYFCGELLDVDGVCGGYNLQWAWSSGYVAGRAAGSSSDKA